jgi:hypothetical protein
LVKLAVKRDISRYTADGIKDFQGYECAIRTCQLLEEASNFILDKENEYFSILSSDNQRDSCPIYQQEHPDAKRHSGIFHLILVHPIRKWIKVLFYLYKVYVFTCN